MENNLSHTESSGNEVVVEQPLVTELCRFCRATSGVENRLCDECRTELHIVINHERLEGTGLETPPEDINIMDPNTLQQWCDWAKRRDGGGGSRGFLRQGAIDSIFAAAAIGMDEAKRFQGDVDRAVARRLLELAARVVEGQSQ